MMANVNQKSQTTIALANVIRCILRFHCAAEHCKTSHPSNGIYLVLRPSCRQNVYITHMIHTPAKVASNRNILVEYLSLISLAHFPLICFFCGCLLCYPPNLKPFLMLEYSISSFLYALHTVEQQQTREFVCMYSLWYVRRSVVCV